MTIVNITFIFLISIIFILIYSLYQLHIANKRVYIDNITNLDNYYSFTRKVNNLSESKSIDRYIYISLDIDNFKLINKTHGAQIGDSILKHIGEVLKNNINPGEMSARLMSDNFGLFLLRDSKIIINNRLETIVNEIRLYDKNLIKIKPSIGVYDIKEDNESLYNITTNGNIAKQMIKGNTDIYIAYFDKKYHDNILKEQKILYEITRALRDKELKLYYQLKQDYKRDCVTGAEVLIRWFHPREGLIMPNEFISILEKTNYITELDLYVLQGSCATLSDWKKRGLNDIILSVNITGRTLLRDGIVNIIKAIISSNGVSFNSIEFEIVESFFFKEEHKYHLKGVISELRKLGCTIAMDDFGYGYTNLNLLSELDIDVLKLDKTLLMSIGNGKGESVLDNTINMAKVMGIDVVAEGVETLEQEKYLKDMGCNYGQGFLYSKPVDIENFEKIIFKNGCN